MTAEENEVQKRIEAIRKEGKEKGLSANKIDMETLEYLKEIRKSDTALLGSALPSLLPYLNEEQLLELRDIFDKALHDWEAKLGKIVVAEEQKLKQQQQQQQKLKEEEEEEAHKYNSNE